jgi:zinc D-Ala-D-Ala carboxypeptidase
MSNERKYFWFILVGVLFVGSLSFGVSKFNVYGQSMNNPPASSTAVSQTAEAEQPKTLVTKTASVSPSAWTTAVADNIRLKNSLQWAFGGKSQRGWYLYESLIQHTISTEAETNTPEFAVAIAAWQQKNALPATGTVDSQTLYQMIKGWQAQRLNRSTYPTEDQLLAAPISDFYDPTRQPELLKIERETYAAYKRMVAAAAKDLKLKTTATGELAPEEKFLRIVSAFRSREYQAKLRAAEPNAGRAALAVNSPHFTGHAIDIYVGGEPVKTLDSNRAIQVQTPVYKWLVKNASKFGFYPYYYEPWHWEYVPQNLNTATSSSQSK